jgi:hypothetical protein
LEMAMQLPLNQYVAKEKQEIDLNEFTTEED